MDYIELAKYYDISTERAEQLYEQALKASIKLGADKEYVLESYMEMLKDSKENTMKRNKNIIEAFIKGKIKSIDELLEYETSTDIISKADMTVMPKKVDEEDDSSETVATPTDKENEFGNTKEMEDIMAGKELEEASVKEAMVYRDNIGEVEDAVEEYVRGMFDANMKVEYIVQYLTGEIYQGIRDGIRKRDVVTVAYQDVVKEVAMLLNKINR